MLKKNELYNDMHISFENICKQLKNLNEEELLKLALIARKSNDSTLLKCFENELPLLNDLIKEKINIEQSLINESKIEEAKIEEVKIEEIKIEANGANEVDETSKKKEQQKKEIKND